MATKCGKCLAVVTGTRNNPVIKCEGVCKGSYHLSCANIPKDLMEHIVNKTAAWFCSHCKAGKRRSIINDGEFKESNTVPEIDSSAGISDVLKVLFDLRNRLISIETSQQFLSDSIEDFRQRLNIILDENKALKNRLTHIESKQSLYEYKLNKMEALLDDKAQSDVLKDVVVTGLPYNVELKNDIVNSLFHVLDIKIQDNDIQSAHFVKPKEYVQHSNQSSRKTMLIIKTNSIELKNNILLQYKNKTTNKTYLRTSDLGINWPMPHVTCNIHIMNHLSPLQTKLYAVAKKIKEKHKFQFLWCKQGKILLRKDSSSNILRIDSFNDINHIENSFLAVDPAVAVEVGTG